MGDRYMHVHTLNKCILKVNIWDIWVYRHEKGELTATATDKKDHKKLLGRRVKWHPALKCWISYHTHSDPKDVWNVLHINYFVYIALVYAHSSSEKWVPLLSSPRERWISQVSHTLNSRDKIHDNSSLKLSHPRWIPLGIMLHYKNNCDRKCVQSGFPISSYNSTSCKSLWPPFGGSDSQELGKQPPGNRM